jgi:hypothetical protein
LIRLYIVEVKKTRPYYTAKQYFRPDILFGQVGQV